LSRPLLAGSHQQGVFREGFRCWEGLMARWRY
jgi:hypothetical protein